jgi:hypothetical protein
MISVLIPTADRPDFLRDAIDSVNHQSRNDLIGEVIVSNNGKIDVEEIVRSYHSLPITYVNQETKLSPGKHFEWLINQAKFPLIAMLADDDMWGRYHLEEAHRQLQAHPTAIAVFNQVVAVRNSYRQVFTGYAKLAHSLQDDLKRQLPDNLIFQPGDLMVDALIHTPLNIWSMLARKSNVLNHFQVMTDPDAGIDSDRYFVWRLSLDGCIIAGREIGLFMRAHPQMAGRLMSMQDVERFKNISHEYSRKIISDARELGIPIEQRWCDFWESLSDINRNTIVCEAHSDCIAFASAILKTRPTQFGGAQQQVVNGSETSRIRNRLRMIVKDCLPPVVTRGLNRARNLLRTRQT